MSCFSLQIRDCIPGLFDPQPAGRRPLRRAQRRRFEYLFSFSFIIPFPSLLCERGQELTDIQADRIAPLFPFSDSLSGIRSSRL